LRETIRYAWGTSTLGDILLAMSSQVLVALEFADERTAGRRTAVPISEALTSRPEGLVDVLASAQGHRPTGMSPDTGSICAATAYEVKVWRMLCEIRLGETTNYGALVRNRNPRRQKSRQRSA